MRNTKQMDNKTYAQTYRVYYEDTDAAGVVYYANYLKFFERARTDFLRHHNINQQQLAKKTNQIAVVRKCNISYIKPAKLDDLITVSVKIGKISHTTIQMLQEITLNNQILTIADAQIAFVDNATFKPIKIPKEIYFILESS